MQGVRTRHGSIKVEVGSRKLHIALVHGAGIAALLLFRASLHTSDFILLSSYFRLHTSFFILPTSFGDSPTVGIVCGDGARLRIRCIAGVTYAR
jgi:hypothetical protein